jgi:predicted choloylglycine hydrolase
MPLRAAVFACLFFVPTALALAQFPAAQHGNGELTHVQGVPVLTVRGTPTEIGEQFGVLAGRNAPGLQTLQAQFLKDAGLEDGFEAIKVLARRLKANMPDDHRTELESAAKTGLDMDTLLFAASVYDLSSGMGCSTIVVETERSTTGQPLFGRNFDWIPTKGLPEHTLVVVFKPTGKRAFATVTFSPITGCISGMNDAGLCCTINEIPLKHSKDKAGFNWAGVPTLLAFRRVLEEGTTVTEAEKLLRDIPRTTTSCLTVCDPNGGAVFEITPKSLEVRSAVNGVMCCTNHFVSDKLGVGRPCARLPKLLKLQSEQAKLGLTEVFSQLHEVSQGRKTLQAMIFEPASRKLHLKLGDLKESATLKDAVTLDLGTMFDSK